MNEQAREFLIQAAMNGTKRIRGTFRYGNGYCALGVIAKGFGLLNEQEHPVPFCATERAAEMSLEPRQCQLCEERLEDEITEIYHLNDIHDLDFLTIARKV